MKTVKDFLIVALLGCLAFMTYVQEGDCVTLKQRTFNQSGGLWNLHARLVKVEGGLSVGCFLKELRACAASLSLKKQDKGPGIFRIFINGKEQPQPPRNAGGSGVFISPTALLTAKHVVEGLVGDITVTTPSGETFKSIEIIEDKDDDVALVIIDRPYGPWIQMDPTPVQLGDGLVCIGNPFSEKTEQRLIVTFARVANERHNNEFTYDGFCWHGCSGGPVIRNNRLVGITFARFSGGDYLGFATPIDRIDQEILDRVL